MGSAANNGVISRPRRVAQKIVHDFLSSLESGAAVVLWFREATRRDWIHQLPFGWASRLRAATASV